MLRFWVLVASIFLASASSILAAQAGTDNSPSQFVWNKSTNLWSYVNLDASNKLILLSAGSVESVAWRDDNGTSVPVPYWYSPGPNYPYISANPTGLRLHRDGCCGSIYWPAKSLALDPGTQRAEVVFLVPTVPVGTKVQVYYGFTDIDCHGGDGVKWYLRYYSAATKKWANVVTPGVLYSDGSHCTDATYATTGSNKVKNVPVSTGDMFAWRVENNGNPDYDTTAVIASVTLP